MSDKDTKNTNSEANSKIKNILTGKRKCENEENPQLKKTKKTLKKSDQNFDPIYPNSVSTTENLNFKIEKTSVRPFKSNSSKNFKATYHDGTENIKTFSKNKFSETFSRVSNVNTKKIFEKENNLSREISNLNKKTSEGQNLILKEYIIKNLSILEIDSLKERLENLRMMNEKKKQNLSNNCSQYIANREVWSINLSKSCLAIEEIQKKKMQLHSISTIRDEEISEEHKNVN
jgi:hypothetical protein